MRPLKNAVRYAHRAGRIRRLLEDLKHNANESHVVTPSRVMETWYKHCSETQPGKQQHDPSEFLTWLFAHGKENNPLSMTGHTNTINQRLKCRGCGRESQHEEQLPVITLASASNFPEAFSQAYPRRDMIEEYHCETCTVPQTAEMKYEVTATAKRIILFQNSGTGESLLGVPPRRIRCDGDTWVLAGFTVHGSRHHVAYVTTSVSTQMACVNDERIHTVSIGKLNENKVRAHLVIYMLKPEKG